MEQKNQKPEPKFISKWFGFSGWRVMSTKVQIFTQIIYRVFFLLGLVVLIVAYGIITGSDPEGLPIFVIIGGWFLAFQVVVNFVFVEDSR